MVRRALALFLVLAIAVPAVSSRAIATPIRDTPTAGAHIDETYYFRLWATAKWGAQWSMTKVLKGPCSPCGTDAPCGDIRAGGRYRYNYTARGSHFTDMKLRPKKEIVGLRVKLRYVKLGSTEFIAFQVHPDDATNILQVETTSTVERKASITESGSSQCTAQDQREIDKDRAAIKAQIKTRGCRAYNLPKTALLPIFETGGGVVAADVAVSPNIPRPPKITRCTFPFSFDPAQMADEHASLLKRDLKSDGFTLIGVGLLPAPECPWDTCRVLASTRWKLEFAKEDGSPSW